MTSYTESAVTFREAKVEDIKTLARLRWEMEAERHGAEVALEVYSEAFDRSVRSEIERGNFRAWIAEADGEPIACAVLIWWAMPPTFESMNRKRGFVSSVYTRPEYRRRGVGRLLMQSLLSFCREQEISRLVLWASDMGRPLYEELGFTSSHGMEFNF